MPSSSGPTMLSSSVRRSVASKVFEPLRSSTLLKPRNTSGRSAVERREITTTFSRPVSRLTRRDLSCGRAVAIAFIGGQVLVVDAQDTSATAGHIDPNQLQL